MTVSASSAGPQPSASPTAPTPVWVAVLITWITAGTTVVISAILTAGVLFLGGPVADAFELPLWWLWVLGIEAAVVACCLCAVVMARGVLRGSNAARWALIASSVLTALVGAMAFYYLWPAVVALAALVVFALLLLPDTSRWARASNHY